MPAQEPENGGCKRLGPCHFEGQLGLSQRKSLTSVNAASGEARRLLEESMARPTVPTNIHRNDNRMYLIPRVKGLGRGGCNLPAEP